MQYRPLGRTGVQVSVACLGTMTFGWEPDDWGSHEEDSIKIAHKAIDLGVNFIDTAAGYGDGRSEKLIGQVLRDRAAAGKREKVFVATKTPPADGTCTALNNE